MRLRPALLPALALLGLATAPAARAASPGDYIALGDSYAYGFTTVANLLAQGPSDGYQGYVAPFAQSLGIPESNVFNLAIPGETVSSFFAGGNTLEQANVNYAPSFNTPQYALLNSDLAALGANVTDITVQLGGNDILGLGTNTAFLTGSSAFQQQTLHSVLDTPYQTLLADLKAKAPNATVFVVGYADPFAGLGAQDPFGSYSAQVAQSGNAVLQQEASLFGDRFVDPYAAFLGHETQYTYITQPLNDPNYPANFPNFHPNATGYAVIAQQIERAAAVPEPAPWALLSLGLPLAGMAVRRRRRG